MYTQMVFIRTFWTNIYKAEWTNNNSTKACYEIYTWQITEDINILKIFLRKWRKNIMFFHWVSIFMLKTKKNQQLKTNNELIIDEKGRKMKILWTILTKKIIYRCSQKEQRISKIKEIKTLSAFFCNFAFVWFFSLFFYMFSICLFIILAGLLHQKKAQILDEVNKVTKNNFYHLIITYFVVCFFESFQSRKTKNFFFSSICLQIKVFCVASMKNHVFTQWPNFKVFLKNMQIQLTL